MSREELLYLSENSEAYQKKLSNFLFFGTGDVLSSSVFFFLLRSGVLCFHQPSLFLLLFLSLCKNSFLTENVQLLANMKIKAVDRKGLIMSSVGELLASFLGVRPDFDQSHLKHCLWAGKDRSHLDATSLLINETNVPKRKDIFETWTRLGVLQPGSACAEHWLNDGNSERRGQSSCRSFLFRVCGSDKVQCFSFSMRTVVSWIYMYIYKYILEL